MAREFDTQLRFGVKDSATPAIRRLSAEFRRLSQARETLGLRGERHLQREIQRTQAAYQRLARSGTLSASEQVRAYDKMQASIARLRQEMAGAERQQRSWLKGALSLGSGLVAGAMTLRQPITRQMDYDAHLRKLANFAYRNDIAKKLNYGYTDFMSYSIDFRRRILSIKKHEGLSIRETAKRFHIGTTTIVRWTKQIDARPATSRQRKIDKSALERDVEQYPDAYQRERAERFGVCQMAICKALKKLQLTYKKNSASSKSRRRR